MYGDFPIGKFLRQVLYHGLPFATTPLHKRVSLLYLGVLGFGPVRQRFWLLYDLKHILMNFAFFIYVSIDLSRLDLTGPLELLQRIRVVVKPLRWPFQLNFDLFFVVRILLSQGRCFTFFLQKLLSFYNVTFDHLGLDAVTNLLRGDKNVLQLWGHLVSEFRPHIQLGKIVAMCLLLFNFIPLSHDLLIFHHLSGLNLFLIFKELIWIVIFLRAPLLFTIIVF